MNKKLSKALVATLVLGTMVPATFASAASFTDINNSYAKDAITRLAELGVINGKDDTHFDPQGAVTRAEFVKILVRSLNLPTSTHSASFTDTQGHWASNFIETAIEAGIINGVGDGLFDPNGIVNREQAATMLVRALQTKGLESNGTSTNFADFDQISDWAKPFIELAQKYNLVKGDGVNFNPRQNATREQAVILTENILRAIDQLKKEYKITPENVTMNVGESKEFKVNGGGTYNTVAWSVSGNGTIDQNGKFTATSAGTATISALVDGAKTVTTSVTVNAVVVIPGGGGSGGGNGGGGTPIPTPEPPVENPETKLSNPTLTIYTPNVDQKWDVYDQNTVFQVNVNFASGITSGDFISAEVSLYNGDQLLATHTAKQALLDLKAIGLSDVLGIGDKADITNDKYWNIGAYSSTDRPTKVVFKLKDRNNTHIVEAPITVVPKPPAPAITADDATNVINGIDNTMEYSIDGGKYTKYDSTNLSVLSGDHVVLVRKSSTQSQSVSESKTLYFTELLSNPTLTIFAPNVDQEWTYEPTKDVKKVYKPNTTFQVNVNFVSGTTTKDFDSAQISLYDGDTLLATDTATHSLLNPPVGSGYGGLTDVFGMGDPASNTDDSWIIGGYKSDKKPTKAVFKLVDSLGNIHLAETQITTVEKPAAPIVTVYAIVDGSDGKISGVNDTMEYQKSGDTTWTPVNGTEITGLTSGAYNIRVSTKNFIPAGLITVITVPTGLVTMGNTGIHGDKVYQEFKLMAGDIPISLDSEHLQSISVIKPKETTETHLTPDTDSSLWFNVQNIAGDYAYTIIDKNGNTYKTTIHWAGTVPAEAMLVDNSATSYAGYKFIKSSQEVNLASFDAMYEIKPYETKKLEPFGDTKNFLWFNKGKPAGTYTFLVKHGDVWTQAVIVRESLAPAMQLTADTIENDSAHDIVLTFTDKFGWAKSITGITVKNSATDAVTLNKDQYVIDEAGGTITIKSGVLATGVYTVTVQATGFQDGTVNQEIAAMASPTTPPGNSSTP